MDLQLCNQHFQHAALPVLTIELERNNKMADLPELVIERNFSASVDLVWQAWTDPELLQEWYGPGVETVIHEFNAVPGGVWLNEMKFGEKSDYQKAAFTEVIKAERLVWHHS